MSSQPTQTIRHLEEVFKLGGYSLGATFRDIPPDLIKQQIESLRAASAEFTTDGHRSYALLFDAFIAGITGKSAVLDQIDHS